MRIISEKFQRLFIYWLILIPFVIWKGGFEGPKIFYFYLGSIFVFLFWIIRVLIHKKTFSFQKSDYFFLLWIFVLAVSSILGIHPFESIVGGSYRHQGVLFFLSIWLIGKTIQTLSEANKKLFIRGLGISILIETIIILLQVVGGNLYFGKPLGTIGEANAAAGFLAIGMYFVFENFFPFYILIPIIAIFVEQSRAALLALAPLVFMIKKRILFILLTSLLLLSAVIIGAVKPYSFSFENRDTIWKLGTGAVFQRPIFGFGAESGETVYSQEFAKLGTPLSNLIIERSHNLFIDIAMWSGIMGLAIFIIWLVFIFKESKAFEKKLAVASLLIYSMFQPLSIVHWILMIIVINI